MTPSTPQPALAFVHMRLRQIKEALSYGDHARAARLVCQTVDAPILTDALGLEREPSVEEPEALDLDRLKALAEAASKGPWTAHNAETREDGSPGCAWGVEQANGQIVVLHDFVAPNDAAFIAAHNPETILRLLAELSRLRGEVEEWKHSHASLMGTLEFEKADVNQLRDEVERLTKENELGAETRYELVRAREFYEAALAAEVEKWRRLRESVATLLSATKADLQGETDEGWMNALEWVVSRLDALHIAPASTPDKETT